jgi:hypothetical protein
MTDEQTQFEMTVTEFVDQIQRYSAAIDSNSKFSTDEYLQIGRLWNTLLFYTTLQDSPAGGKFFRLVRDKLLPTIRNELNMQVARGYSFYSEEHDFILGGTLGERFRYRIAELENSKH